MLPGFGEPVEALLPPARWHCAMPATRLAECVRCHVLVHATDETQCPRCRRALSKGGVRVGFADAREVYGEPGAPWTPPPPPTRKPPREFVLKCRDGHKARSEAERVIDDWLHEQGILHEREPRLVGMHPDWRVGNVYVEYWGLAGNQGYDARREEKRAMYAERGLRLVELTPDDLDDLDARLGFLREVAVPKWF